MTTTPSFATTELLSAPFRGLSPERVAYCGSVSKMLSPALRIGWTVLPHKWIDEVSQQKLFDDMGTTVLEQLTLACFFDAGGFTRNLRRMRAIYRRRRNATLHALATSLPAAVSSGVAAGLHVIRAATAMVRRADPRRGRPRPRVAHRRSQLALVRTTVSATGVGARLWCARRTSDPPRPSDPRLDLPSTTIVVGLTGPAALRHLQLWRVNHSQGSGALDPRYSVQ